jgi:hypothetical protein
MPLMAEFYGIVIRMFFSDHDPPHCMRGEEAKFLTESVELRSGGIATIATKPVIEWAASQRPFYVWISMFDLRGGIGLVGRWLRRGLLASGMKVVSFV